MKTQPKFYYLRLLAAAPFILIGVVLYLFAALAMVTVDRITGAPHSKHLFGS